MRIILTGAVLIVIASLAYLITVEPNITVETIEKTLSTAEFFEK